MTTTLSALLVRYSTDDAFLLGLRHGGEDASETPELFTPTYGNPFIQGDGKPQPGMAEQCSAYADGYLAEWNATLDARRDRSEA